MSAIQWTAIILAGGKGTRMKSPLPKVLHPVAGDPMISRVIRSVKEAGVDETRVVVGYAEELVRQVVEPLGGMCYLQKEQNGTADAVRSADVDSLGGFVLILNGDHPLIKSSDIEDLMKQFRDGTDDLAVVSTVLKKSGSFGRIVRHQGSVRAIVEAKDASASTLAINEVNTGIYLTRAETLQKYLPRIKDQNASGEFYLTDLVALCREDEKPVGVIQAPRRVSFGVNDQIQLAQATKNIFLPKARQLMEEGVVIVDPKNTYIEDEVSIGAGSVIYPGAYIKGKTSLGSFCVVEPNSFIIDSEIRDSVQIKVGSHLEKATVKQKTILGPYARLRPQTILEEEVQIGNFVEIKKAVIGKGTKAGHLTYIGDAEVGTNTNIGCGTITCNYAADRKKYKTIIGNDVFVGSDTQFCAPVEIGDGAFIGSGSTITKDVPAKSLAVARGKQIVKENYQPKSKSVENNTSAGQ